MDLPPQWSSSELSPQSSIPLHICSGCRHILLFLHLWGLVGGQRNMAEKKKKKKRKQFLWVTTYNSFVCLFVLVFLFLLFPSFEIHNLVFMNIFCCGNCLHAGTRKCVIIEAMILVIYINYRKEYTAAMK